MHVTSQGGLEGPGEDPGARADDGFDHREEFRAHILQQRHVVIEEVELPSSGQRRRGHHAGSEQPRSSKQEHWVDSAAVLYIDAHQDYCGIPRQKCTTRTVQLGCSDYSRKDSRLQGCFIRLERDGHANFVGCLHLCEEMVRMFLLRHDPHVLETPGDQLLDVLHSHVHLNPPSRAAISGQALAQFSFWKVSPAYHALETLSIQVIWVDEALTYRSPGFLELEVTSADMEARELRR